MSSPFILYWSAAIGRYSKITMNLRLLSVYSFRYVIWDGYFILFFSTSLCLDLNVVITNTIISIHRAPNGNRIPTNRRSQTEWIKCFVSVGGILTASPVGATTPSSCHVRASNKNRSIAEYCTYTSISSTPSSSAGGQQAYRKWNTTSPTSACWTRLPLK